MGLSWGEQSAEIAASPEACFGAIVEYETFPEWQDAVVATEVIERDDDGLGKIVEVHVDAKVRRVRYRLRYHYDRPHRVWWDFDEGDGVHDVEGEYTFEPRDGGTLATYRLGIDAGVPIPGLIARRLNRGVMRRTVDDRKRRAEGLEERARAARPR
jgi:ribosome-associated toxin RatA of RatAB toxin-antitoxin module